MVMSIHFEKKKKSNNKIYVNMIEGLIKKSKYKSTYNLE